MNDTPPPNVKAWMDDAPRNCHTCVHFYDNQCEVHKATPPPEFAEADDNECGKWRLDYKDIPF